MAAAQQPLLRDVINIKETISTSDFVLSLAKATTEEGAEEALRDYVVTERLLENFDQALGLIKSALDGHTSKAAYPHGSFGSGKSHFMAVLYALLSGDTAARVRGEFDPVLTKHEWLTTEARSSCSCRCRCQEPRPCWSRRALVLVRDSAEAVASVDIEAGEPVGFGDQFRQGTWRRGV
jgi:hypothetical protein